MFIKYNEHPFYKYDIEFSTNFYKLIKQQKGGGKNYRKGEYVFYIDELEMDESIKIFIGNPAKNEPECVHIRIDNSYPEIANLIFFHYDSQCSINKRLKKGSGTKKMMEIIIAYLKQKYPKVKMIDLNDTSKIDCKREDNTLFKFKLYKWFLFLYGEGYYQHNYGFNFLDEYKKDLHNSNLEVLKNLKVSYKEVVELLKPISPLITSKFTKRNILSFLKEIKNGELWTEAIKKFREKGLFEKYCSLIDNLLERIISKYGMYDLYDVGYRLYL